MDFKTIAYAFSDGSINEYLTIIARDFKVVAMLLGGPIMYYLAKIVRKTKWKSDDILLDKLSERFGLPKGE